MTPTDLSKLDSLIDRQHRRGIDIRPTLLRMLTDVYVARRSHTPQEKAQYVDIALKLIDEVDADTRRAVARLLSDNLAAPAAVLERLRSRKPADDGGVVARAGVDQVRDSAFGQRFFDAAMAERRSILAALADDGTPPPLPTADAASTVFSLERSALAGHPGDFICELERALRLPRETAERIVNDVGGEPMVVAARALAMPLAVLQRVLMFLNPAIGHSVRRVYDLSALYEEVTPAAARRLTAAWSTSRIPGHAAPNIARESGDQDSPRSFATARPAQRRVTPLPDRRAQRTS